MSSIVLELQHELLQQDCDIVNSLRKAHVIAVKLGLDEFDLWIQQELSGYKKLDASIPDYRMMRGVLKAKNPRLGWIPAVIEGPAGQALNVVPVYESLAALIDVGQKSKDGYFMFSYSSTLSMKICKQAGAPTYMDIALFISVCCITEAVEQVKNRLLEWTLTLEKKGILGEGMTFNATEKETARELPQQINYYGTVINGNVSGSQIISGNNNTVTYNATAAYDALKEIRESLERENISNEDMESAVELLDEISEKIEQNKKPGIIKSALIGLKDFVLAVGADLTAALIAAKIQGMF